MILSSDLYNEGGPGHVIVCPVLPGEPVLAQEFTGYVPITSPLIGTVLAELIERFPASGLTEPRGTLSGPDRRRVDQVVRAVLGHI